MPSSHMGTCIRLAMTKKGITGKELAAELNVTETTVSRWRKTGCDSLITLRSIAKSCDTSAIEMMRLAD